MTTDTTKFDGITVSSTLDELITKLQRGQLKEGDMVGTEVGLARQLGMPRMAVRKALEPLIAEGLVVRQAGKGLYVGGGQRLKTIAIVVPGLELEEYTRLCCGVRDAEESQNLRIQIYDSHRSLENDVLEIKRLPTSGVHGAIIGMFPHPHFAEAIYELKRQKLPFVLIDGDIANLGCHTIFQDPYAGGYLAGQKIIEAGHKRIGFIGNMMHPVCRSRLEGLRDAIADATLLCDRKLFRNLEIHDQFGDWSATIKTETNVLIDQPDPPTAIFCVNDGVAITAHRHLRDRGVRIPEDISIVGFDNEKICSMVTPTLATIDQPSTAIGAMAIKVLTQVMENPDLPTQVHKLNNTTFIPGESLGPPRAGKIGESR